MQVNSNSERARGVTFASGVAVFVASACVMMVELAAGRIISRHLGQSVYAWTSVIGVILAGLSLGNGVGGRLADRFQASRMLSILFAAASLVCFSIPAASHAASVSTWLWMRSWPVRILGHTLVAFFLPSFVLGTIAPVAVRMALEAGHETGRIIGRVYALGAIGSIAGTFAAGFFLIEWLGSLGLIVAVAMALGLAALGFAPSSFVARSWAVACLAGGGAAFCPGRGAVHVGEVLYLREAMPESVVYRDESEYQYIAVKAPGTNRQIRAIYLDKMMHSEMDLDHPTNLLYRYSWVYEAIIDKLSGPARPVSAFVIGGGGYTFPQYLELTRPGSRVDVAEIDPAVTCAAFAACGLRTNLQIGIYDMDARNFVAERLRRGSPSVRYDYVLGDTFNDYSVPYHLTTLEFTRALSDLMTDRGVYMLNMIDQFDSGRFLGSIVRTCREVFPCVRVFFCHRNLAVRGTYVVVCAKQPMDLSDVAERAKSRHDFYGSLLPEEAIDELIRRSRAVVLTDDYAPVENLLADVVRRDRPDGVDVYYLKQGLAAAGEGRMDEAIRGFEESLRINPGSAPSWFNLGVAWMQKKDSDKALSAFAMALQIDPTYVEVRNNAAVVLAQSGRIDDAMGQLEEILALRPDNVDAHINLAALLASKGRKDEAIRHLEEALKIQPRNPTARGNLERLKK